MPGEAVPGDAVPGSAVRGDAEPQRKQRKRRKRYKEYLWDRSYEMPGRTKRRLDKGNAVGSVAGASDAASPPATGENSAASNDMHGANDAMQTTPSCDATTTESSSGDENIPPTATNAVPSTPPNRDDGADSSSSEDGADSSSSDESVLPAASETGSVPSEISELDDKLYPGCRISQGESLLLVMGHSLRHHGTKEATESLLQVIEAHLPEGTSFPMSKYLFYKQFSGCKKLAKLHFYCPDTMLYLGAPNDEDTDILCSDCESRHTISNLTKNGTFFITLDIESQCRDILEDPKSSVLLKPKKVSLDVGDITFSKAYNELPLTPSDISFTWNTDGVPLYESSKFSVWPLQLQMNAEKAERNATPCRGIKGVSVLLLLAFFKFPTGFVVDYMHAVCSGFVKYTTCMWFDCKSAFPFSMGGKISVVDSRLLSLQPIHEMSRLPRSLVHRRYWKSSEWRNWLLYFSPVVLRGLLPPVYYKNWVQFVYLMHFLLKESIPLDELRSVAKQMKLFLKEYEKLYGKEHITYNAHLLLPLVDSVREWGPLWNYSAYSFENMNGSIVKLVNGTRYAHWQIVEKYLIMSALPKLCSRSTFFSQSSAGHLMTTLIKHYKLKKFCTCLSGCVFYGKSEVSPEGISFSKVRMNGVLFCVERLDKSRRLNSYVEAVCDDGSHVLGRIVSIFSRTQGCHMSDQSESSVLFYVQELRCQSVLMDLPMMTRNFSCVQLTNRVVKANAFSAKKCVALKVEGSLFLCCVDQTYMFEAV
ncbi:uncharacterized protein LOC115322291 [Ixodes scapularis]|uniref:uncharacterized protein LOC115322291 n=1 Tax=Ixodes scapularis TaxID=6945 RepID=UPI001A9E510A|nr:uncharacterized protein LOC115322291 [Ixodes scapularis]